jgi:hypothetical protein
LTDKTDDCSVKFKYGDTINVIFHRDEFGNTKSNAIVTSCDIVSDEFTFKVKAEKLSLKISFRPVDSDSWLNLGRIDSRTFFADIRTLKRDNNGSFVWFLINDTASRVQSQRQLMHGTFHVYTKNLRLTKKFNLVKPTQEEVFYT